MKNKYSPKTVTIKLPIEIKTEDTELYFTIEDVDIIHHPERPMPNCQNPDKPAFYDPGDPEENEFRDIEYVELQIREQFNLIIEALKAQLEVVVGAIGDIDLHELLPKGYDNE